MIGMKRVNASAKRTSSRKLARQEFARVMRRAHMAYRQVHAEAERKHGVLTDDTPAHVVLAFHQHVAEAKEALVATQAAAHAVRRAPQSLPRRPGVARVVARREPREAPPAPAAPTPEPQSSAAEERTQ